MTFWLALSSNERADVTKVVRVHTHVSKSIRLFGIQHNIKIRNISILH